MKRPETYKVIREEKDEETGRTIYIEVLVDDLSKVSISPFPRPKRKREYTEEELQNFVNVLQNLATNLQALMMTTTMMKNRGFE